MRIVKRIAALIICFSASIVMATSSFASEWIQDSKGWKLQDDSGNFYYDMWAQNDGKWYCFDNDGYMNANMFITITKPWEPCGYTYYVGSDGAMIAGSTIMNTDTGDWWSFNSDGQLRDTNSKGDTNCYYVRTQHEDGTETVEQKFYH